MIDNDGDSEGVDDGNCDGFVFDDLSSDDDNHYFDDVVDGFYDVDDDCHRKGVSRYCQSPGKERIFEAARKKPAHFRPHLICKL